MMSFDLKKLEKPVMFAMMIALLVLAVKNCDDDNKSRETNEIVKDVAANVDTIQQDVKEVKNDVKEVKHTVNETHKIVRKVEKKLDTIEAKIDTCCDCGKKPVVQPVKPKDTIAKVPVKIEPKPVPADTCKIDDRALQEIKKVIKEALDSCCCDKKPVQIEQPKVIPARISCTTRVIGYGGRSR